LSGPDRARRPQPDHILATSSSDGLAELTTIEGLNPTTLSRVVGKLDSFGLIRRLRDPEDLRAARIEVTPDGLQAWQHFSAQRAGIMSECVAGMPAEEEAALAAALPALENVAEGLKAALLCNRQAKTSR
jgi:DNA-binding MarR family transcriptional regulator